MIQGLRTCRVRHIKFQQFSVDMRKSYDTNARESFGRTAYFLVRCAPDTATDIRLDNSAMESSKTMPSGEELMLVRSHVYLLSVS